MGSGPHECADSGEPLTQRQAPPEPDRDPAPIAVVRGQLPGRRLRVRIGPKLTEIGPIFRLRVVVDEGVDRNFTKCLPFVYRFSG